MKKLIKRIIYRLTGDSRREIMAELKHSETQLLSEITELQKQIVRLQQTISDEISGVAERLLEDGSPLRVEFFQLQELLRQESDAVRQKMMEERVCAENRLLEDGSPLRVEFFQLQNLEKYYSSQECARIEKMEKQLHIHMELAAQDMLIGLSALSIDGNPLHQEKQYSLCTDYPIAYESPDHLHPLGTKNDNTRAPFFIRKCETLFPEKESLRFADLGCSGGGIVLDALLRGHQAIGLEGSDYSLKNQRAEWRLLRNNLFTCDIAKPFTILDVQGNPVLFDIVSAWEVFEHIPQDGVAQMIENIAKMLAPGGYFIGTVSQVEDHEPESGAALHLTIKPAEWWYKQLEEAGLERVEGVFERRDTARAWGNPPLPWLIDWVPEKSPVLVVRKPDDIDGNGRDIE